MSTVHNPANFEPRDYEVVDYLDNRRPEYHPSEAPEDYRRVVEQWEREMAWALGESWRSKIHRCVHCGNTMVRWITAVEHKPTSERVVFGADCTHRLGFADKHAFKLAQLQAKAEARKIRFTVLTKRAEFVAAHPSLAAALARIELPTHKNNAFVKDVLSKLDQWGTLSDAQVAAVEKSLQRDVDFAARKAAEDLVPKGDAPSGRVQVTGVVVSTKWVESDFGSTQKMLVKLENNSKVWVTVPGKESIGRGDQLTFKASFTVSRDDRSFAFGSRPHLVKRVAAEQQQTEQRQTVG